MQLLMWRRHFADFNKMRLETKGDLDELVAVTKTWKNIHKIPNSQIQTTASDKKIYSVLSKPTHLLHRRHFVSSLCGSDTALRICARICCGLDEALCKYMHIYIY
jgi:hypothetical protein